MKMIKAFWLAGLSALVTAGILAAELGKPQSAMIERLDPAINAIVPGKPHCKKWPADSRGPKGRFGFTPAICFLPRLRATAFARQRQMGASAFSCSLADTKVPFRTGVPSRGRMA